MNRAAQAVVLLLLGGAVLRVVLADMHLRYVKPSLGPLLVGAGLLLVAAAAVTLYQEHRRETAAEDTDVHPPATDHEHDHHHDRLWAAWLILLPVVGLLLVSPAALGSYSAQRSGTAVSGPSGGRVEPLPAGDPVALTLLDYAARAVYDRGASLGQRRIQLTGFLAMDPAGQPYLARMILSCCAADGQPVKVGLAGNTPAGRPADTWVTVVGTYTGRTAADPINGETIPYLRVERWQQVRAPKQQYE